MDKHHILYKNMVLAAGTRAAVDFGVKRRLSLQTKPSMALSKYSQVMREAIEACLNTHYQETNKQFRLFKTSNFFIENNTDGPAKHFKYAFNSPEVRMRLDGYIFFTVDKKETAKIVLTGDKLNKYKRSVFIWNLIVIMNILIQDNIAKDSDGDLAIKTKELMAEIQRWFIDSNSGRARFNFERRNEVVKKLNSNVIPLWVEYLKERLIPIGFSEHTIAYLMKLFFLFYMMTFDDISGSISFPFNFRNLTENPINVDVQGIDKLLNASQIEINTLSTYNADESYKLNSTYAKSHDNIRQSVFYKNGFVANRYDISFVPRINDSYSNLNVPLFSNHAFIKGGRNKTPRTFLSNCKMQSNFYEIEKNKRFVCILSKEPNSYELSKTLFHGFYNFGDIDIRKGYENVSSIVNNTFLDSLNPITQYISVFGDDFSANIESAKSIMFDAINVSELYDFFNEEEVALFENDFEQLASSKTGMHDLLKAMLFRLPRNSYGENFVLGVSATSGLVGIETPILDANESYYNLEGNVTINNECENEILEQKNYKKVVTYNADEAVNVKCMKNIISRFTETENTEES